MVPAIFLRMGELAIHPPVHVSTHPDEPIRTLDAATKFVLRHVQDTNDSQVALLLAELRGASTPEHADRASVAFRRWAEGRGLLLVPPEDRA
jgi:hypothetical protein